MTVPGLVPSGGTDLVVEEDPSVVYVVQDSAGVVSAGLDSAGVVSTELDSGEGVSIITVPGLVPSGGTVLVVGVGPSVV